MSPPESEHGGTEPKDDEIMRIFTAHQGLLYACILSAHPYRAATQNILQETHRALWKQRDLYTPGPNFRAWTVRADHFQIPSRNLWKSYADLRRIRQGVSRGAVFCEAALLLKSFF